MHLLYTVLVLVSIGVSCSNAKVISELVVIKLVEW